MKRFIAAVVVFIAVLAVVMGRHSLRDVVAAGDGPPEVELASAAVIPSSGSEPVAAQPQGGGGCDADCYVFTYQGYLEKDGVPVNGTCDLAFSHYTAPTGGTANPPHTLTTSVREGLFTAEVNLGWGPANQGGWVETQARCPAGSGTFTTLSPRTRINGVPFAHALRNGDYAYVGATTDGGYVQLYGAQTGDTRLTGQSLSMKSSFGALNLGAYGFYLNGPNGTLNAALGNNLAFPRNEGSLQLFDASGNLKANLLVSPTSAGGVGGLGLYGPNGQPTILLTDRGPNRNLGFIGVNDISGQTRATMTLFDNGAGSLATFGPNGNANAALANSNAGPNHGWLGVYDPNGAVQASMYVDSSNNGVIFADIKNFRLANPLAPGTEIVYASLEGPEAGAYIRGTAKLVDGRATIIFPDHFRTVAAEEGMTVQVTPLSADSLGLAVVSKSLAGVEVRELQGGNGTYEFDYHVTAVRQGYESYEVIRPSSERDSPGIPDTTAVLAAGENGPAPGSEE